MSDEYDVGYKKPPVHSRFKKGQSGNPLGRKKAVFSMLQSFYEELQTKILIKENGKEYKINKGRAYWKSVLAQAMKGNPKAMELISKTYSRVDQEVGKWQEKNKDSEEMAKEDLAILARFERQILEAHGVTQPESGKSYFILTDFPGLPK